MSRAVPSNPSPRRRRRPLLWILVTLLVLLLVAGVVAAVWVGNLGRSLDDGVHRFEGQAFPEESLRPRADAPVSGQDGLASPTALPPGEVPKGVDPATALQGPQAPAADEVADQGAVNYLVLGADTGVDGRGPSARSDTMMWVHIPGDRSQVQVVSIMRDTWVPIPGHGDKKINAAFQYGGIPMAVATVENIFQARVDHVVALDMAGFEGLVDELGGVTVDNPTAFTASNGHPYPAGSITMDGKTALVYARERYNLPRSDFDRVENQQRLVKAIIAKGMSLGTLSNPATVQSSVDRFAPYLTFDSSLDSGTLASLAWSLRDVRSGDIKTSTLPSSGVGYAGDQAVVWPNWPAINEMGRQMRTGQ